jgi:polar amino acid transport system substrate-binding protein
MSILKLITAVTFSLFLVSCDENKTPEKIKSAGQLNSPQYIIGVPQGAAAMFAVEKNFPKAQIKYYDSLVNAYAAVKTGRIDAFAFDKHSLEYVLLSNPDLALMPEKIADESIVAGAPGKNSGLIKKVNSFIAAYRADGTYHDMRERWLKSKNHRMPDIPAPEKPEMTITVGTEGMNEPMNYYKSDGSLTGFDIEFIRRLALFLNAKINITAMTFDGLIPAAESGKIDLLIANLNSTPEREKKMALSNEYVDSEIVFMVRKDRLADADEITSLEQLSGQKTGVITGTKFDKLLTSKIPGANPEYFVQYSDCFLALRSGKISGVVIDEPMAVLVLKKNPGFYRVPGMLAEDRYAFIFGKDKTALQSEFNRHLEELRESGKMEKLRDKWMTPGPNRKLADYPNNGKRGVLKMIVSPEMEPFTWLGPDGKPQGYEIELALLAAEKMGFTVEFTVSDFNGFLEAVKSGKADIGAACLSITEERKKSMLFSEPHYSGGVVVIAARERAGHHSKKGFFAALEKSFRRTFIVEGRYKLILEGLRTTIVIAVASAVLGTLLAFPVCVMRRSQRLWASLAARLFIMVIQGTPMVVLLMILYYVVFGSVSISGVLVAILAFGMNFAAYVSEMMRGGYEAIDRGQREAASALGFGKWRTFRHIIFPQAARHIMPVYRGEFISMLKTTAVVGYIAVQDLTKMSDIIRSRTYDAFFPLIATALIYFMIAYVMISLLKIIEVKIDPKRRRRAVAGVTQQ